MIPVAPTISINDSPFQTGTKNPLRSGASPNSDTAGIWFQISGILLVDLNRWQGRAKWIGVHFDLHLWHLEVFLGPTHTMLGILVHSLSHGAYPNHDLSRLSFRRSLVKA